MKTNIDIKSAVLGLVIGVLAVFAIGAASAAPQVVGRYQIAGTQGYAWVIDTATGQVWSANQSHSAQTNEKFFSPKRTNE